MAAAATVFGGLIGFLTGLIGLVFFSLSPLFALALWSGSGIVSTFALIGLGLVLHHAQSARRPRGAAQANAL